MLFRHLLIALLLVLAAPLAFAGKININTADLETLSLLDGIGEKKAQAIINYRTGKGFFKSIGEITKVSGIGEKILQKNKDKITVGDVSTESTAETVVHEPVPSTQEANPENVPSNTQAVSEGGRQ